MGARWSSLGFIRPADPRHFRRCWPDGQRIQQRTVEAYKHAADSDERQVILKEVAQLRVYLEAKLWIDSPGLKPGR